ncbi:hypothetical protein [Mesomycoplasma ovipneumoniae]|uniref:hypothetical protein n=1 Tax=Mesomycoplasma ovipneumoniae TaxID=29562 RepID=UPI003080E882
MSSITIPASKPICGKDKAKIEPKKPGITMYLAQFVLLKIIKDAQIKTISRHKCSGRYSHL